MFRKAIIAIAASGLLAACAHSQEVENENIAREPSAAAASSDSVQTRHALATRPVSADGTELHAQNGKPAPRLDPKRDAKTEQKTEEKTEQKAEPDNTAVNKRDTKDKTLTPMDQGNSGNDLKITQEIRKAVVGADGLSFTAKNVKIITRDANVTLRGPVKTSSEKQRIDELVRATAGVARVDNQLEVESPNQSLR